MKSAANMVSNGAAIAVYRSYGLELRLILIHPDDRKKSDQLCPISVWAKASGSALVG